MALELATAQNPRIAVTWEEIYDRVNRLPTGTCYGIPRGGTYVAAATQCATTLEKCDYLVDDIWDSGKTAFEWEARTGKKVHALFDKRTPEFRGKWLIMPWEETVEGSAEDIVIRQLQCLGQDVTREGLRATPRRVVRSWDQLYAGYRQDPAAILSTCFEAAHSNIVLLQQIEFYSTCEHHLLPFFGKAHVAYIPQGRVVGISKLARLVECFARRLQIQEVLCDEIADALMTHLQPRGAACILEAQHMCMMARGIAKQQSLLTTSAMRGVFAEELNARQELLRLIHA